MNEERIKEALDSIARRNVPDDIDTWPLIASRFERRSLAQALRARPVLLIVVLLLSLALLSGAVYAIGRLAGFVPGFGFATGEVYVLDEPVELVQNGITLRLEGAAKVRVHAPAASARPTSRRRGHRAPEGARGSR